MSDEGHEFIGGVNFNKFHKFLEFDDKHFPFSGNFKGIGFKIRIFLEKFT